jgi:hypothetical protein
MFGLSPEQGERLTNAIILVEWSTCMAFALIGGTVYMIQLIAFAEVSTSLEVFEKLTSAFSNLATIFAFIAGGIWAISKYRLDRKNEERIKQAERKREEQIEEAERKRVEHIELKVSGKILKIGETPYLLATAELKNVGLTLFIIDHDGTGIRVGDGKPMTDTSSDRTEEERLRRSQVTPYEWEFFRTLPVFEGHEAVEPGESLYDQQLAQLKDESVTAYRLKFRINTKKNVVVHDGGRARGDRKT